MLLLLITGCNRYRHALRKGTLREVGSSSVALKLIEFESKHELVVANEAADGACLELQGLRVTVDGVSQSLLFEGGRGDGRGHFDFGPVNRTDYCSWARATIEVPDDPYRPADVFDVEDGTTKLHAEFPNVLASSIFTVPPPPFAHAGDSFTVSIAPPATRGTGKFDPGNFATAYLDVDALRGSPVKLPTRAITPNQYEVTIPATVGAGAADLMLVSVQEEIPATVCSAGTCSAAQNIVAAARTTIR